MLDLAEDQARRQHLLQPQAEREAPAREPIRHAALPNGEGPLHDPSLERWGLAKPFLDSRVQFFKKPGHAQHDGGSDLQHVLRDGLHVFGVGHRGSDAHHQIPPGHPLEDMA